VGNEHESPSKRHQSPARVRGRKLADRLTPESSEPRRMIENHGLKSEVLCVSKLDSVKIIPTAEKNSEKDETARSLTKPITDAQQ
jgi:hypothetical protein